MLLFGGDERNHLAALATPEAHRLHAVAERRIDRRMRLLQRPGHDADLPQGVVLIHRVGGEVRWSERNCQSISGGIFQNSPWIDVVGLRPQFLHDPPILIEDRAVALIGCGAIGLGRGDAEVLAEGADPAWRVAAREPGEYPPAGEVVEHRDVLGKLDRIDGGEVHPELANAHRLGVLCDEIGPRTAGWWSSRCPRSACAVRSCRSRNSRSCSANCI